MTRPWNNHATGSPRFSRFCFVGSGKGAVLPPPPPLRTGRESFPSSGSSRYKAPCDRSRFSRRFNPSFMAMDSENFVERTVCKIVLPTRIKRIGIRPDFQMSPDFGVAGASQFQPNGFPLRCSSSSVHRKRPVSCLNGVKISLFHPSRRFA